MIERVVRNDEVVGLIPICSTILESDLHRRLGTEGSVYVSVFITSGTAAASIAKHPVLNLDKPKRLGFNLPG